MSLNNCSRLKALRASNATEKLWTHTTRHNFSTQTTEQQNERRNIQQLLPQQDKIEQRTAGKAPFIKVVLDTTDHTHHRDRSGKQNTWHTKFLQKHCRAKQLALLMVVRMNWSGGLLDSKIATQTVLTDADEQPSSRSNWLCPLDREVRANCIDNSVRSVT